MLDKILDRLNIIMAAVLFLFVVVEGVQLADQARIKANREAGEEFVQDLTISMELEDQVGQLLITTPEQLVPDHADARVQMTEDMQQALESCPVGGIILSQGNTDARADRAETQGTTADRVDKEQIQGTTTARVDRAETQASTASRANEAETQANTAASVDKADLRAYAAELQEYSESLYQPLMVAIIDGDPVYDPNEDGSCNLNSMWFTVQLYGYESNEAAWRNIRCIEGSEDPAAEAIAALNDDASLLYVPEDLTTVYDAILAAVKDGTISEERLRECLHSALMLKYETGLTLHARGG